MNKNLVKVSAPGKLMLFGEHAVIYGRPCIATAVDERMYLSMQKINKDSIVISAPDVDIKDFKIKISDIDGGEYPKGVQFILGAIKIFFEKYGVSSGLKIKTKSEFSSLFGFGSSSAVTVCTFKALSEIFNIKVSNKTLFDMAYKTVLCVQGVGSGFDIAVAVSGGTIYFVRGGKEIKQINVKQMSLIVGYTGIKADTSSLVVQVGELYKKNRKKINRIFDSIGSIVKKAKPLLEKNDYNMIGQLMNKNQELLSNLGVSSKKLDLLIKASLSAGALGAKLSGAGGGDCMVCLPDEKTVDGIKKAISNAGGTVLDVTFNAEGVRIE